MRRRWRCSIGRIPWRRIFRGGASVPVSSGVSEGRNGVSGSVEIMGVPSPVARTRLQDTLACAGTPDGCRRSGLPLRSAPRTSAGFACAPPTSGVSRLVAGHLRSASAPSARFRLRHSTAATAAAFRIRWNTSFRGLPIRAPQGLELVGQCSILDPVLMPRRVDSHEIRGGG